MGAAGDNSNAYASVSFYRAQDAVNPLIHSNQTIEQILGILGPAATLVLLTAPDGSRVLVNAKRAKDSQGATADG